LLNPTRQSFESYFQMMVCRLSACAIERMRSYTRRVYVGIPIFSRKHDAYINVTIGRAPAGRGDARDNLDSSHLRESTSGQVTSSLCGDRPGAY
jgi:hypothetical protein